MNEATIYNHPSNTQLLAGPALVHPATAVVFAIRVGSSMNLLRLPTNLAAEALQTGAVWSNNPLPALREIRIAEFFGKEWCVVNCMHQHLESVIRQAFESAARQA